MLQAGVLRCLGAMLSSPKKGIRKETCWTISNITAGKIEALFFDVLLLFTAFLRFLRKQGTDPSCN